MRRTLEERFWAKVRKTRGCWFWTAAKLPKGYGLFGAPTINERLAHRVSWVIHFGKVPKGKKVLHTCDTPGCVRPTHLFTGTQKDNIRDMDQKGRRVVGSWTKPESVPRGVEHHNAKLTEKLVRKIRVLHNRGVNKKVLYKLIPVHPRTTRDVINGKSWKHVS